MDTVIYSISIIIIVISIFAIAFTGYVYVLIAIDTLLSILILGTLKVTSRNQPDKREYPAVKGIPLSDEEYERVEHRGLARSFEEEDKDGWDDEDDK